MADSTTDATDQLNCDVKIEEQGPCRKQLTITVPAESVDDQLTGSMDALVQEAAIPGFRPGRAPRRLIEKRFGSAVRNEAKGQIVASAFSEAVQQHDLRVIGDPEPGEDFENLEVTPGSPMVFTVTVEVAPEFDLPDFSSLKVVKPLFEATDEHVDNYIERLQTNEGSLEDHDDAAPGDYLIGHGIIRGEDGTVHLDVPGAVVQRPEDGEGPEGQILGIKVEDFGEQIGAPKKGDVLSVKTTGPESHEQEELRGAPLTIEFNVEQVQRILPMAVEDLVTQYGLESEQQLREMVTLRLNQRALVEQQSAMRRQVSRHLIENADFEVPENITARQAARNLERARLEMLYQGAEEQDIESRLADMRASSNLVAQRELKLFFVLQKIAAESNIEVTDPEIMGRIAQMASERGVRPEQLRKQLIERNQVQGLAEQIREHKALDAALSQATLVESSPEDFRSELEKIWGEGAADMEAAPASAVKKVVKKKTQKKASKKTSKKTASNAGAAKG